MRLVMMGTGSFAEPTFDALLSSRHAVVGLVTQPDRPTGKERGSTRQPGRGMKDLAQERGIPVLQPESINTAEGVAALAALNPELLVVAAYGQILSNEVLATAPHGGINVHASLLPKYRGAAPINWAIYHGEKQTGVTIIRMSTRLDAGNILVQEATPIGPEETAGEVEARLAPLGASLALRVIDRLALGPVTGIPQDLSKVTKAPKLKKEDGLIDWSKRALTICNQVRAMQPWPTAYTYLHRAGHEPLRLIICKARPAMEMTINTRDATPGLVRPSASGQQFFVETGEGDNLEILELQPFGKRRMNVGEFLRGNPVRPGAIFGGETPPRE